MLLHLVAVDEAQPVDCKEKFQFYGKVELLFLKLADVISSVYQQVCR